MANAVQAKIPVVIIDSDLKSDKYVSFVATDNYKGGVLAAEHMGKLLNGKGNVILLRYAVGSASTEAREAGFLDTLKTKYPDLKLLSSDQYAGRDARDRLPGLAEPAESFGREVNGIFCPNEPSTIAMTKALRDIGKAGGKVKMIGFDAGSQSVADMKSWRRAGLGRPEPGQHGLPRRDDHGRASPGPEGGEAHRHRRRAGNTRKTWTSRRFSELLHPPLEKYLK